MSARSRRISVQHRSTSGVRVAVQQALAESGILDRIRPDSRVAIKPNFTYPYYKKGVTTSPVVLRAVVEALRECTNRIAVVETDGGYGAWKVAEAFRGHGLDSLVADFGIETVNLCDEPREQLAFTSRGELQTIPLPTRLLHETDAFLTMPVPKIHAMTGLTLAYKNQWGVVPDIMRLRRHYLFDDAIVAINQRLRPMVVGDGTYFLDQNGPMEGEPVRMDLIIGASDAGTFDRYVSQLMGWSYEDVHHLRRAAELGDLPRTLAEIEANAPPDRLSLRRFRLRRTPRNWAALAGFRSRFLTWFGYESWFGRGPLHTVLYAIAGKPVQPKATDGLEES